MKRIQKQDIEVDYKIYISVLLWEIFLRKPWINFQPH